MENNPLGWWFIYFVFGKPTNVNYWGWPCIWLKLSDSIFSKVDQMVYNSISDTYSIVFVPKLPVKIIHFFFAKNNINSTLFRSFLVEDYYTLFSLKVWDGLADTYLRQCSIDWHQPKSLITQFIENVPLPKYFKGVGDEGSETSMFFHLWKCW